MQPSTSTIFGLLRGLCSAPTSRSPITGAAKSKQRGRWRRSRHRKKQLSLAFESSPRPEIMQVHQWGDTAARPALPLSYHITTLLRLRLRGHPYARSGLPNSSQLPPVHVWWLSHVTRLRATTGAPCQLPKSTNCNRNWQFRF